MNLSERNPTPKASMCIHVCERSHLHYLMTSPFSLLPPSPTISPSSLPHPPFSPPPPLLVSPFLPSHPSPPLPLQGFMIPTVKVYSMVAIQSSHVLLGTQDTSGFTMDSLTIEHTSSPLYQMPFCVYSSSSERIQLPNSTAFGSILTLHVRTHVHVCSAHSVVHSGNS